jgi:putative Mg2+ transporter-C (MgtC) family protein
LADLFGWSGASLGWGEVAVRLASTLAASALIGLDRRRAGQAAGLRTLLLVGLAAAVAMLQANLLLPARGKSADSFAVLDLMRMPLGILTGIGFIGAGAIVRRGSVVVGVTTAATLWFTTILGLCFGGGQIALGWVATALALAILYAAKRFERRLREERQATLRLTAAADGPSEAEILARLEASGFRIVRWVVSYARTLDEKSFECGLAWDGLPDETLPPPIWEELQRDPRLRSLGWAAEKGDP